MTLKIQIETILFSILLGSLAFFMWKLMKKLIYHKKIIVKLGASMLLVELFTFIYIKGLLEINNLHLHFYSYFFFILSFLTSYLYIRKV